ncbi:G-protein-signaling modulator 2-like isoform X2 [Paramacrobiotus metropolitanus]|uniref:G-protein-signaling modulator 2-like isoform X2 n=1 Tax=Paramacrobiotus metropolitanus TaxID=2943436 RepID=UPI0024457F3D|nr:G-protein-signaling modulator 2-like isoform X2 [Paramacrobiotus metropolitanus]
MPEFDNALEYHSRDLALARSLNDEKSEARASGNIATTLKSLGQFDEAIACAERQLELYRKLRADPRATSRALYNLANILHAKGKCKISLGGLLERQELPEDAVKNLTASADYYLESYVMVKEMHDIGAQGRVCGNLGNLYYIMGDFSRAVLYHQERLTLARQSRDVQAERRAYTNLGNCHIFLGQYSTATECYLKSLALVDTVREQNLEAQTCYNLANSYALMQDYKTAVNYYQRHLFLARELMDIVGEGRACCSLGAAYAALGDMDKAIKYAKEHLKISKEIGDSAGYKSAQNHLIAYAQPQPAATSGGSIEDGGNIEESLVARIRRISMEHMDALQRGLASHDHQPQRSTDPHRTEALSGDFINNNRDNNLINLPSNSPDLIRSRARSPSFPAAPVSYSSSPKPGAAKNKRHFSIAPLQEFQLDEEFFDFLSRAQGHRLDDQRCSFRENKENQQIKNGSAKTGLRSTGRSATTREELMDYIAGIQSRRLNEQRAELPPPLPRTPVSARSYSLPVSTQHIIIQDYPPTAKEFQKILSGLPENSFLAELMAANNTAANCNAPASANRVRTDREALPDSFFDMLMKHQGARMEDQRASISLSSNRPPVPRPKGSGPSGADDRPAQPK